MTTETALPKPQIAPAAALTSDEAKVSSSLASNSKQSKYETPGEKIFEDLVYNKMNFWVNLAGSLAFTESAEYGGKNPISKGIYWLAHEGKEQFAKGLEKLSLNPTTAEKVGHGAVNILALGMVGHLLVFPIKYLENNKLKYVQKLDNWLDDHHNRKPDEAETTRRNEAYARLAEEKPPSWGQLWLARVAGQGVNIILVDALPKMLDPRNKKIPKNLPEGAAAADVDMRLGQERITYWIGDQTKALAGRFTQDTAKLDKAQWWGYIVSLETLCTRITSGVLHGLVALGKRHKEKQIEAHEEYCAKKYGTQDSANTGTMENNHAAIAQQAMANQSPESLATGADAVHASLAQRGTNFAEKYAVPSEAELSNYR